MSDTPRTEQEKFDPYLKDSSPTCVDADFARQLGRELTEERNLHGQTRAVVEELNTICNDLRNAGKPEFIRSEAIRLLREDQAELRNQLARARADSERLVAACSPILAMRPDGDIGWRGQLDAKCGWVRVKHILAIEAAIDAARKT